MPLTQIPTEQQSPASETSSISSEYYCSDEEKSDNSPVMQHTSGKGGQVSFSSSSKVDMADAASMLPRIKQKRVARLIERFRQLTLGRAKHEKKKEPEAIMKSANASSRLKIRVRNDVLRRKASSRSTDAALGMSEQTQGSVQSVARDSDASQPVPAQVLPSSREQNPDPGLVDPSPGVDRSDLEAYASMNSRRFGSTEASNISGKQETTSDIETAPRLCRHSHMVPLAPWGPLSSRVSRSKERFSVLLRGRQRTDREARRKSEPSATTSSIRPFICEISLHGDSYESSSSLQQDRSEVSKEVISRPKQLESGSSADLDRKMTVMQGGACSSSKPVPFPWKAAPPLLTLSSPSPTPELGVDLDNYYVSPGDNQDLKSSHFSEASLSCVGNTHERSNVYDRGQDENQSQVNDSQAQNLTLPVPEQWQQLALLKASDENDIETSVDWVSSFSDQVASSQDQQPPEELPAQPSWTFDELSTPIDDKGSLLCTSNSFAPSFICEQDSPSEDVKDFFEKTQLDIARSESSVDYAGRNQSGESSSSNLQVPVTLPKQKVTYDFLDDYEESPPHPVEVLTQPKRRYDVRMARHRKDYQPSQSDSGPSLVKSRGVQGGNLTNSSQTVENYDYSINDTSNPANDHLLSQSGSNCFYETAVAFGEPYNSEYISCDYEKALWQAGEDSNAVPLLDTQRSQPDSAKRRKISKSDCNNASEKRLACPYFKREPEKYRNERSCPGRGWMTVHRLKGHLYKCHKKPIQCDRCSQRFQTPEQRIEHQRSVDACIVGQRDISDGFDTFQEAQLRSKKQIPGVQTEEDKWRRVWTILFPKDDVDRIPDPYYVIPSNVGGTNGSSAWAASVPDDFESFFCERLERVVERRVKKAVVDGDEGVEAGIKRHMFDFTRDCMMEVFSDYKSMKRKTCESPQRSPKRLAVEDRGGAASTPALSLGSSGEEVASSAKKTPNQSPDQPGLRVIDPQLMLAPGFENHNLEFYGMGDQWNVDHPGTGEGEEMSKWQGKQPLHPRDFLQS